MLNLPILRWGQPYTSLEQDTVAHFITGETLAKVSQANTGLLGRDMRQAHRAREVLTAIPIADLIGKNSQQLRLDQVSTARVAEYSGEDADAAWRLCGMLEAQLAEQGLDKLYRDLEIPLIEVLAEMEFNGVRLDVPLLEKLSREMANQLSNIENEIYRLAGR